MGILSWLVVGLVAGYSARFVVPGSGPGGLAGDLIIGLIGAFVGGWAMSAFGQGGVNGLNPYSILVAFVGAVILLFIMRAVSGNKAAP